MSDPIRILPHSSTDLAIPPIAAIRARAAELADQAWRQQDTDTYRQLVNLIDALKRGMQMVWVLGDLIVSSASTAGVVYTVSCGACNCPAYKPCKHLKLAEVLLDMLDTLAGDADMEADIDEWEFAAAMDDLASPPFDDPLPDPGPGGPGVPGDERPWYASAAMSAARRSCWAVV